MKAMIIKIINRIRKRDMNEQAEVRENVIDRRQFFERALSGAALVTTAWLATDQLYDNYGRSFEDEWLKAYYKSDFVGV